MLAGVSRNAYDSKLMVQGIPSVGLYVENHYANKKPQISIVFASPGTPKDSGNHMFDPILSQCDIGGESEVRFGLSEHEMGLYKASVSYQLKEPELRTVTRSLRIGLHP